MELEEFNEIIEMQNKICMDVLVQKAGEYATEDRLHNFNVGSALSGTSPRAVLAGFMLKHTTSIYDMCYSDQDFSRELWSEKITDHINYLYLLRAAVEEELRKANSHD